MLIKSLFAKNFVKIKNIYSQNVYFIKFFNICSKYELSRNCQIFQFSRKWLSCLGNSHGSCSENLLTCVSSLEYTESYNICPQNIKFSVRSQYCSKNVMASLIEMKCFFFSNWKHPKARGLPLKYQDKPWKCARKIGHNFLSSINNNYTNST